MSVHFLVRRWSAIAIASLVPATAAIVPVQMASAAASPVPVFPQDVEVYNSQRGMYSWLTIPSSIPGWQTADVYWRDQIQWGAQVEKTRGVYDFSAFEQGMQEAANRKGRFSFRIMALCPGCGGNLTPSYVPRQSNGAPDWNSDEFLSGYERLMAALGAKYDKDPRLGVIDVGAYGLWGEWGCDAQCGTPITDANVERLLRGVSKAFPSKYFALGFSERPAELAAQINPKIGLRFDCIGGFSWLTLEYLPEPVKNVWRRAPVVGEWCPIPGSSAAWGVNNVRNVHLSMLSSGDMASTQYDRLSASEQTAFRQAYILSGFRYAVTSMEAGSLAVPGSRVPVTVSIRNLGVAPTYDSWTTSVALVDSAGRTVASVVLPLDLRSLAEGQASATAKLGLPSTLPPGKYTVAIQAADAQRYLQPLAFANPGRDAKGRHPLGSITVSAPVAPTPASPSTAEVTQTRTATPTPAMTPSPSAAPAPPTTNTTVPSPRPRKRPFLPRWRRS